MGGQEEEMTERFSLREKRERHVQALHDSFCDYKHNALLLLITTGEIDCDREDLHRVVCVCLCVSM